MSGKIYITKKQIDRNNFIMNNYAEAYRWEVLPGRGHRSPYPYRMRRYDQKVIYNYCLIVRSGLSTEYADFKIRADKRLIAEASGEPHRLLIMWKDMAGIVNPIRGRISGSIKRDDRGDPLDHHVSMRINLSDFYPVSMKALLANTDLLEGLDDYRP